MNRLFLAFARLHSAACQYFYERSRSPYWLEARDRALQEQDDLERRVLSDHINRVLP